MIEKKKQKNWIDRKIWSLKYKSEKNKKNLCILRAGDTNGWEIVQPVYIYDLEWWWLSKNGHDSLLHIIDAFVSVDFC